MGELKRTTKEHKKTPWPEKSEEKYMTGQKADKWPESGLLISAAHL